MYKYWGFGLQILSQIEFPELLPCAFTDADVTIEIGPTPEKLIGDDIVKKTFSYIGKEDYLLNINNICRYYAANGNKIIAEPKPGIDEKSIRLFLLGTIMAAILYQRGSIPMHASAIVKDDKLVVFAGNSGAGKSTLLAYLTTLGYAPFSDDICVMHHNIMFSSGIYCTASYPMMKLWDDAITDLDNKEYTRNYSLRPELPKYGQFFYDTFNKAALPIDKVFILHSKLSSDNIEVSKLLAINAFRQLELQAYKNQLILGTKLRGVHFSLLSELINTIPVYNVIRPLYDTTVEQLYLEIKALL